MNSGSLLPRNATDAERAAEQAVARVGGVPAPLASLWNPMDCPEALLPWLAWGLSVDTWDAGWSDMQKREAIRSSMFVHRHKGTAGAVRAALSALGLDSRVVEWFEADPPRPPYTFAIEVDALGGPITVDTYDQARRIAASAKNARSHLSELRASNRTVGTTYVGAATACARIVSIFPG